MPSMKRFLFCLSLIIGIATALDVELVETSCDESLPVSADVYLKCDSGARCTFGGYATIFGTLYYNGLEDSGIQDNIGYLTSDLSLWSLSFNLFDMTQIQFCHDMLEASENNQNECPGDGAYGFSIDYKLPSAGTPATSWLASGWSGSGRVQVFSAMDDSTLIGDCSLNLVTYVTPQAEESLVQTPSAKTSLGLLAIAVGIIGLMSLYCCLCQKKRKLGKADNEDDLTSQFKRMEGESVTYYSGSRQPGEESVVSVLA